MSSYYYGYATATPAPTQSHSSGSNNAVVIAVPVILGMLALIFFGCCCVCYFCVGSRKRPVAFVESVRPATPRWRGMLRSKGSYNDLEMQSWSRSNLPRIKMHPDKYRAYEDEDSWHPQRLNYSLDLDGGEGGATPVDGRRRRSGLFTQMSLSSLQSIEKMVRSASGVFRKDSNMSRSNSMPRMPGAPSPRHSAQHEREHPATPLAPLGPSSSGEVKRVPPRRSVSLNASSGFARAGSGEVGAYGEQGASAASPRSMRPPPSPSAMISHSRVHTPRTPHTPNSIARSDSTEFSAQRYRNLWSQPAQQAQHEVDTPSNRPRQSGEFSVYTSPFAVEANAGNPGTPAAGRPPLPPLPPRAPNSSSAPNDE